MDDIFDKDFMETGNHIIQTKRLLQQVYEHFTKIEWIGEDNDLFKEDFKTVAVVFQTNLYLLSDMYSKGDIDTNIYSFINEDWNLLFE